MHPFITDLLTLLKRQAIVRNIRVVSLDETPSGRIEAKIRCQLSTPFQFQIWLHSEPDGIDYAYQLFTSTPLLRWDNTPHYPKITTAPHHFHDENGVVGPSPLTGDPLIDLPFVLKIVEIWLQRHSRNV